MDVFNFFFFFFFFFKTQLYNDRDRIFSRALYCNGIWNKTTVYDKFQERAYCERNKGLCGIYDKDKILKHQFFCAIEYVFTFFFFFFF